MPSDRSLPDERREAGGVLASAPPQEAQALAGCVFRPADADVVQVAQAEPVDREPVRIGDCTFIGANSVILMGVTIGSHCIIGAGSVVTSDIPDGALAVGVPARTSSTCQIDAQHPESLPPSGDHAGQNPSPT